MLRRIVAVVLLVLFVLTPLTSFAQQPTATPTPAATPAPANSAPAAFVYNAAMRDEKLPRKPAPGR
jgi:hypothetical protein